jgi:peptide deformylase
MPEFAVTAIGRDRPGIVAAISGALLELECLGFEARCVQHEMDHLDGILFLDRVESLVDDVFRRRVYAEGQGPHRPAGGSA